MKNINPFKGRDKDRCEIWDMLVDRDIKAFLKQDWQMVVNDFSREEFIGTDAGGQSQPDAWQLNFPDIESYRDEWQKQAKLFADTNWGEDEEKALFRVTVLRDIDLRGDKALAHKKFFGNISKANGDLVPMNWQSLYRCRKISGQWRITGFTGFMPHSLKEDVQTCVNGKSVPENAGQHGTAGPYSPVLIVDPGKLVVISGQASIGPEGKVIGETIEEQTAITLENCSKQLTSAGCSLDDVFKVNVFLKDLDHWSRFNEVYKGFFRDPLPVRTAVGSGLLMTMLVEIEMWAINSSV